MRKRLRIMVVLGLYILIGLSITSCVQECEYEVIKRNSQGVIVDRYFVYDDCNQY